MSQPKNFYIVNGLTLYRLVSAPLLLLLAFYDAFDIFKWLLLLSFLTDAVDGFLARKYKVASVFGARVDSIADDVTVFAATISLFYYRSEFVREHWIIILSLICLLVIQNFAALIQYNKMTSFHTYMAKVAAIAQAAFFLAVFFNVGPVTEVFYLTAVITGTQLIEETLLVALLPEWKANVKGIFWVLRHSRRKFVG